MAGPGRRGRPGHRRGRAGTLDLLAGHLTWAAVDAFPAPPRVLVVVRDPIDRMRSAYSYLRQNVGAGIFSPVTLAVAAQAASASMGDLVLDRGSAIRLYAGPVQVAFLSSTRPDLRWDATELMPGGELDDAGIERALATAIRNLEACWWVGTTETLSRDLGVLASRLGWRPTATVPRANATLDRAGSADLSGAAWRELDRLTQADRALHDRARALADEAHEGLDGAIDDARRPGP